MRAAIGLAIAALACVAIAWWVAALPGSVTATIAGTTLSTSTPVAILLFVVLFVVLYIIVRLLGLLFSLPRRHGRWQARRDRGKGEAAINRALIALAANDPNAARREADRGRRLLGDTPVTLLLAAQAGKQAGREQEAEELYGVLANRKDSRLVGLRGLLRLAVEREDWDRAAVIARDAERAHPGAKWLRDERRHLAQQTGNWDEAMRLSGADGKATMAIEAARRTDDPRAALDLAKQAFDADPGLPPAVLLYAQALRQAGRDRQAQDALRKGWSACPHPDIADAFVSDVEDKAARARELAVLVRSNPENEESYLVVARAALAAGMVADARRQLEQARSVGANDRRFWTLLADTAAMEGDTEAAQEARQHVPVADPDPIWRCTVCGTHQDGWHAVCGNCRSTSSINWSTPKANSGETTTVRRMPRAVGFDGLTT